MADTKISGLTGYTTPLDADVIPVVDTANTTTKKVTWSNIKATLKTYFDTLYQSLDATLTALAGLNSTGGIVTQTATDTFTKRSIAVTASTGLSVSNGDGVSGNPTLAGIDSSLTVKGIVELATTAEIDTGTDSTRAIPVDQYVASNRNIRYFIIRCLPPTTSWTVGTTIGGDFRSPFAGTMVSISAWSDTAGTTGTATVDVNKNGTTIMGTNKLNWDSTEKSTATYSGTAAALSVTSLAAEDIITVDIDTNHTTPSTGLTVKIGVRLT